GRRAGGRRSLTATSTSTTRASRSRRRIATPATAAPTSSTSSTSGSRSASKAFTATVRCGAGTARRTWRASTSAWCTRRSTESPLLRVLSFVALLALVGTVGAADEEPAPPPGEPKLQAYAFGWSWDEGLQYGIDVPDPVETWQA